MSVSPEIKTYQQEYLRALLALSNGDPRLEAEVTLESASNDIFTYEALNVSFEGKMVSPFHHKLITMARFSYDFWTNIYITHRASIEHLSQSKAWIESARQYYLLNYFETIVCTDNLPYCYRVFHQTRTETEFHTMLWELFIEIRRVLGLKSLIMADTDEPLLILFPNCEEFYKATDYHDWKMGKPTHPTYSRAFSLTETLFDSQLKEPIPEGFLYDLLRDEPDPPLMIDADRYFESTLRKLMLDSLDPKQLGLSFAQEFKSYLLGESNLLSRRSIGNIRMHFLEMAMIYSRGSEYYEEMAVVQCIPSLGFHSAFYRIEGDRLIAGWKLAPDYIAAQTLTLPRFDWLNNITLETLIRIRELGAMDEMRDIFRDINIDLSRSPVASFEGAAQEAQRNLEAVISDAKREVELSDARFANLIRHNVPSIVRAILVSVLSFALPPAVGIATGVIVGGGSVWDLINAHLSGRSKLTNILKRPIWIYDQYLEN